MFGLFGGGKKKTDDGSFESHAAAALAAAASGSAPAPKPAGPQPRGRRLQGQALTINLDALQPEEAVAELQVQPITLLKNDLRLEHSQQVAVSSSYICYGLKAGHIRALNRFTADRALFKGHPAPVSHMAFFAPGTPLLASASRRGDVTVRAVGEAAGGGALTEAVHLTAQLPLAPEGCEALISLAWHPKLPQILAAGAQRGVHIFEVPTDAPPAGGDAVHAPAAPGITYPLPPPAGAGAGGAGVTCLAFSPEGDLLLAGDSAGGLHAWWLEGDDEAAAEAPLLSWQPYAGGGGGVGSVHFLAQAADGSSLLLTGDATNAALKLWALPPAAAAQRGGGAPPACLQALSLASAGGPGDFFCHVAVQRELQLVVLANTVRRQIYTLHYMLGAAPGGSAAAGVAGAAFDYAAFFAVKQPVLSLTSIVDAPDGAAGGAAAAPPSPGDAKPGGGAQLTLYCVQTDAIQQYTLSPALCEAAPGDAGAAGAVAAGVTEEVEAGEEVSSSAPAAAAEAAAAAAPAAEAVAEPEPAPTVALAGIVPEPGAVPPPAKLPTPALLAGRAGKAAGSRHEPAVPAESGASAAVTSGEPRQQEQPHEAGAVPAELEAASPVAAAVSSRGVSGSGEEGSGESATPAPRPPMPPSSLLHSSLLHSTEKAPASTAAGGAGASAAADAVADAAASASAAAAAASLPPADAVGSAAPGDLAGLQQQVQQLLAVQQQMVAQLQASPQQTVAGVKAELSRALKGSEASLLKQVEAAIKAAHKKAEEERRKAAAKEREALEKALAAQLAQLSTGLQRDFAKTVSDVVREQARTTVGAVVNAVTPAVAAALQQELAGGGLVGSLEASLSSSLARPLHEALRENFASSLIPAFERATQVMFGQVEGAFSSWLSDSSRAVAAAQSDAASGLSGALSQLQALVASMRTDLADTSRSLSRLASSTASRAGQADGSGGGALSVSQLEAGGAAAAPVQDPRTEITSLLAGRRYDAALVRALNTASLDVLLWTCNQMDPGQVLGGATLGLSQTTLLSLVHQLAADLRNDANTPLKLSWLGEAAPVLDPHDPQTAPHLKGVLTGVMASLKQLVNSLPPSDARAKQGKITLHLFNSLLHQ